MSYQDQVRKLEQLRSLRREVDLCSQRIAELERAASGKGRITGMPNCAAGWDRDDASMAKLAKMAEGLEARRLRCMELLGELYDFIDGVEDSRMRLILTYRYIDGESWQRVAFRIGETDEQYPRRLHRRYLEGMCGEKKA